MNILMLSLDDRVFEEGSEARERMRAYGGIFESLHIIVFTRENRSEEKISHNISLYPSPASFRLSTFRNALGIGTRILEGRVGQWVITSQDAFANIIAFRLRKRFHVPVQVEVHTDFFSPYFRSESFKNRARYHLYRWSAKRADCVRVVSRRLGSLLQSKLGIPSSKITVLPVFVDISRIVSGVPDTYLRNSYPRFHPLILVVGRLTAEKNVSLALDVFARLMDDFPKGLLVIAGDGPELESLKFKAKSLKLGGKVRFEGWQKDAARYYRGADVLLVTSRYEGYGRVFIEAAASGLPIVTTPVGIVGDVLKSGESVLAFHTAEEGALAIRKIIANHDLRRHLVQNAREALAGLPDLTNYLAAFRASVERCGRS